MKVHGAVPAARSAALEVFTAGHTTTARLLKDHLAAGCDIGAIHAMDEYTLDVVVPLPDGLVLVYGTT